MTTPAPIPPVDLELECKKPCELFGRKAKRMGALWVAITTLICFLVIGSPLLYMITGFLFKFSRVSSTGARGISLQSGIAFSWIGWAIHSLVAFGLAYGIGFAFMQPKKADKCCCPGDPLVL
jgi:heme/copper-type cytochrome/quinol oxidase subunit 2